MNPSRTAVASEEDFPFGWRFVPRTGPNGESELVQVALTLEDVLYPQPEDVIPHRKVHDIDCGYLASVFRARVRSPRHVEVTADRLVDWNVPGLRNHSPDIGVFVALPQPSLDKEATLCLSSAEEHCRLIVEVVSPHTRENDVERKMKDYHLAGVPLYILIDQVNDDGQRWLEAYRHTPTGFQAASLDTKDRLHLPLMNLYLSVKNGRAVCEDATSGKELGDYSEITRQLEAADERNQVVEGELEVAIVAKHEAERGQLAAEQARLAAEQRNQTLDAARLIAQQETLAAQEKEAAANAARVKAQEKELAADAARVKAQEKEAAADAARVKAQEETLAADAARVKAQEEKVAADAARVKAQEKELAADAARVKAQEEKLVAEAARIKAQEEKLVAEAARAKAQEEKLAADAARHKTEQEKHALNAIVLQAQQEKLAAESDRLRVLQEQIDAAEIIRQLQAQLKSLQGGNAP